MKLMDRAEVFADRVAIVDGSGEYTYADLLAAADRVAGTLGGGGRDLHESRVAFMVTPTFAAVAALWGIWRAGGIAVPVCTSHPEPEIDYVLADSGAETVLFSDEFTDTIASLTAASNRSAVHITAAMAGPAGRRAAFAGDRRALILYTSGTTGRPKGVVLTRDNIDAQITCLVEAWEWSADDRILSVLPLHHTHGLINVLSCALWSGAGCEMMTHFDADEVWRRFAASPLTLFMAVPTIYFKLSAAWLAAGERQEAMTRSCAKMRLMVSGSAALPAGVFDGWQQIAGHVLLERYGMTEIGMALSNPVHGERRRGCVGVPLPRVEIRRVDEEGQAVTAADQPGELLVRGPGVFLEYWNRAEETAAGFVDGDWFKTGDIAVQDGLYFRILGRRSVDIIKTAGYKVSALEIEEILREHPQVDECSVVGIADPEWGERVCAACVPARGGELALQALRTWAKRRMAAYKVPSRLMLLDELPKNAMGKVTKPTLRRLFEAEKTDV